MGGRGDDCLLLGNVFRLHLLEAGLQQILREEIPRSQIKSNFILFSKLCFAIQNSQYERVKYFITIRWIAVVLPINQHNYIGFRLKITGAVQHRNGETH